MGKRVKNKHFKNCENIKKQIPLSFLPFAKHKKIYIKKPYGKKMETELF